MSEDVTRISPRKKDILLGRGSDCWNHEGNKQFRITIANYQEIYHSMSRRADKVELVAKVVDDIQASGTRFLKRIKNSNDWKEVDRKFCIEKVGHAIRDKQISKYRINQRAKEDPSRTKTLETIAQERETPRFENPLIQSNFGGTRDYYADALEEATCLSISNQNQRMTAWIKTKSLDPTLNFETSTNSHRTTSPFESERLLSKVPFEVSNYDASQSYQAFPGDWIYQRLLQDLKVKLLRSSTLDSLLIKYRQKETRDQGPLNPIYLSSLSPGLLLSQSSRTHATLSARLGFHHSTMPSVFPIHLTKNPIRSISNQPIIISIGADE